MATEDGKDSKQSAVEGDSFKLIWGVPAAGIAFAFAELGKLIAPRLEQLGLFPGIGIVTSLICGLCYAMYCFVRLGGWEKGNEDHHKWYRQFVINLKRGDPSALYVRGSKRALAKVDEFFERGRDGKISVWQQNIFGIKKFKGPIWTASSLDRCILLAYIYPRR